MAIEFNGKKYVHGVWVNEGEEGNWFAALFKPDDTGVWQLDYRMRYFADNKLWNSKDRFSWYEVIARDGSEEELAMMIETAKQIQTLLIKPIWPKTTYKEFKCRGDDPHIVAWLEEQFGSQAVRVESIKKQEKK